MKNYLITLCVCLWSQCWLHLAWAANPVSKLSTTAVDIDHIIASMTREEKVGQLLMVGFAGTTPTPQIVHWVRDRGVGGVALFARNIVNLPQVAKFTHDLQALSGDNIPLFIALDQEGGTVVRVHEGVAVLPGNMALGATNQPVLSYTAGQAVAIDLRLLGFNMNLAPVLDVNSNPQNPVIGVRSFGESPQLVGHMGQWFIRGHQDMGVVAVAKHFPGHGNTRGDSHFLMPTIQADANRLQHIELLPFKQAIEADLDAIMTAHIALPQLAEGPNIPATLSFKILTKLLREQLGFDGLIITDGLEMQAIVQRYGIGRAAVLAILAGADMPMVLWDTKIKEEAYQALLNAVYKGEISAKRLDLSVRRILTLKARRGLFDNSRSVEHELVRSNPWHQQIAQQIAQQAVTLVRNEHQILPLQPQTEQRLLVLAPEGSFSRMLAARDNTTLIHLPSVPSRQERLQISQQAQLAAQKADLIIAAVVNRYHLEMIRALAGAHHTVPIALLSFASPYYLQDLPQVDSYICTYSFLDVAQVAAAEAVLGIHPMTGRLPVSIPQLYPAYTTASKATVLR